VIRADAAMGAVTLGARCAACGAVDMRSARAKVRDTSKSAPSKEADEM